MGKRIVSVIYWLLPAYFLFQSIYQIQVLGGLQSTYENGQSYLADVVEFRLKNMQAQSNGILEIRFETDTDVVVQKKMTLPIQLAAQIREYGKMPIRYLESSAQPIVIIPTYIFHRNMVRMNVAILVSSLIATIIFGYFVLRWARKLSKNDDPVFVRLDE